MSAAEVLRQATVAKLVSAAGNQQAWRKWRKAIRAEFGRTLDAQSYIDLGSYLRDVFQSTNPGKRTQSSQSSGGAKFENLVCWYLNLGLVNTRAVVLRDASMVPSAVRSAMTVHYGSTPSNTEADLVGVTLPAVDPLDAMKGELKTKNKAILNASIETAFAATEVCVLQCKTNWKDNAQIPMLWDLIYAVDDFGDRSVSVGENGFDIRDLRKFSYSLVTVPTNDPEEITAASLQVRRVAQLSGGTYWGTTSKKGVALSLGELPRARFSRATEKSSLGVTWRDHLDAELPKLRSRHPYFKFN